MAAVVGVESAAAIAFARDDDELAFVLAVALFGSFALVDEAMADYELDATHREVLVFVLAGYLATRQAERGE